MPIKSTLIVCLLILTSSCSNWGNKGSRSTASANSGDYDVNRSFTIDSDNECCVFPLDNRSLVSIDNPKTFHQFGAARARRRLKSSASIIGLDGDSVRAISGGTILYTAPSYNSGTKGQYIAIKSKGLIIGYGGLKLNKLRQGDEVKKGQNLGKLISPPRRHPLSRAYGKIEDLIVENKLSEDQRIGMLYIDMFVEREGIPMSDSLKKRSLPFKKRKDLVNPTDFLQDLEDSLD